jgi:hypothetical protein
MNFLLSHLIFTLAWKNCHHQIQRKNCFRKDEWMSVSNMLNVRCVYLVHTAKESIGSTNYFILCFVHAKRTQERAVVNLKLM